jgi:hypothetical protein
LKVGITGHQERPGIDWTWVGEAIGAELARLPGPIVGLSALARGADQVFAEAVLAAGGRLVFVRPTADYESNYEGAELERFRAFRAAATEEIYIPPDAGDQDAFLAAGKRVVEECDVLIAVWDGKVAHGKGGTADIVEFARARSLPIIHIEPFARTVLHIG